MWIDVNRNPNPRGTFLFSSSNGAGSDFENFLLGLPAQETVQYSLNADAFHANGWDLFVTDDWKVAHNLTLNLGLRYEYVSPFSEENNQIANLDVTPGFTNVVPVLPGQPGYPVGLIHPDRNNWAPRVGLAWKPFSKTVVRAGYGINYNLSQYRNIVQQLALNPGLRIFSLLRYADSDRDAHRTSSDPEWLQPRRRQQHLRSRSQLPPRLRAVVEP